MIDTVLCGLCHSNNFVSIFTPQQIKQFALTHGWSRDFFDPLHKNWWNGGLQLRSEDTTCSTHMAIDLNASAATLRSICDPFAIRLPVSLQTLLSRYKFGTAEREKRWFANP
jgi:hypothetical protein